VVVAVMRPLGPAVFLPSREPFDRLMEFVELVMGGRR
jgi:hypothetical protein